MRVAAGVILIFVALIDLFASIGYLGVGAVGVGSNAIQGEMEKSLKRQNNGELSDDDRKKLEEFHKGADKLKKAGGGLVFFGVYLLVTAGVAFISAIFLFTQKNPKFIIIAGVMVILGEAAATFIVGFGVMKVFGLVGGLFGILAARQIIDANRAPPTDVAAA